MVQSTQNRCLDHATALWKAMVRLGTPLTLRPLTRHFASEGAVSPELRQIFGQANSLMALPTLVSLAQGDKDSAQRLSLRILALEAVGRNFPSDAGRTLAKSLLVDVQPEIRYHAQHLLDSSFKKPPSG